MSPRVVFFSKTNNGPKIGSHNKNNNPPDQNIEETISHRSVGVPMAGYRQIVGKNRFPIFANFQKSTQNLRYLIGSDRSSSETPSISFGIIGIIWIIGIIGITDYW